MEWDGSPGSYDSFLSSRRIHNQKLTKQGNVFDPVGLHRKYITIHSFYNRNAAEVGRLLPISNELVGLKRKLVFVTLSFETHQNLLYIGFEKLAYLLIL